MNYLEKFKEYEGMKPGLSRIKKFLDKNGSPQNELKFIHIAGTNGKGSTAAYIAEILKQNNYKTGLYTSPHLIDISERIKINGKSIPKKILNLFLKNNMKFAKKCKLSFFEILTAIAFMYFKSQKTDIVVLETGLGGNFDATNIIKSPDVCIITSISQDHIEILGNSIEKIASEKAGIIKKNAALIVGDLPEEALETIGKKTAPKIFGKDFIATKYQLHKKYQRFDFDGKNNFVLKNIKTKMLGRHQIINVSLSLSACAELEKRGFVFKKELIKKALFNVKIPARFDEVLLAFNGANNVTRIEDLKKAPKTASLTKLIIDGSHNEESVLAFIKLWGDLGYNKCKVPFIFAVMKEKNYAQIIKMIIPFMSKVIIPNIKNTRAVDFKTLKTLFLNYLDEQNIIEAQNIKEALKFLQNSSISAAIGSLYLAGSIYKALDY